MTFWPRVGLGHSYSSNALRRHGSAPGAEAGIAQPRGERRGPTAGAQRLARGARATREGRSPGLGPSEAGGGVLLCCGTEPGAVDRARETRG
jgi:hypothetical protein